MRDHGKAWLVQYPLFLLYMECQQTENGPSGVHCSTCYFKWQPTLPNVYHITDGISAVAILRQNQTMLRMTKSTLQKATAVWQLRTQWVSSSPLSKLGQLCQLCLPRTVWGGAGRQLCSHRRRSCFLHIWKGYGTSSSPNEWNKQEPGMFLLYSFS